MLSSTKKPQVTLSSYDHPTTQAASLPARGLIYLIRAYQLLISPLLGPRCRFYPTCSNYAAEAFKHHSFLKAIWLSVRRICKCHPGHPGGIDELPLSNKDSSSKGLTTKDICNKHAPNKHVATKHSCNH